MGRRGEDHTIRGDRPAVAARFSRPGSFRGVAGMADKMKKTPLVSPRSPAYESGMKRVAVMCLLEGPEGFLLLKRSKPPHVGHYVPVGGHVENYESPRRAVVREVKEETGIEVLDPILKGIVTETSPVDYNWIVYVYGARIPHLPPPSCPEGELSWVKPERLSALPIPEIDRHMYRYLLEGRFFVFEAEYDQRITLAGLYNELNQLPLLSGDLKTKGGTR